MKYLIVALIFLSPNAFALQGGMEGGGGKVVVCRNQDHSIRSAEALDLYEGREVYGLRYKESDSDWKTQAVNTFYLSSKPDGTQIPPGGVPAAGNPGLHVDPGSWLAGVISHFQFLSDGTTLKSIDDSREPINFPEGCSAEQTVNYISDNLILVNGEIWKALSETQKAAIAIHESAYRFLRTYGETDSIRSRHFTAYIIQTL